MHPLVIGGAALTLPFLYQPAKDLYNYANPNAIETLNELRKYPRDALGNPMIPQGDDIYRRLEWTGISDRIKNESGGMAGFLKELDEADIVREAETKQRIRDLNPINRLNDEFLLDQKRDLLEQAKHRRAQLTSNDLFRQQQAEWRNDDLIRQSRAEMFGLENQALQIANNQKIALDELQDRRDRFGWEQSIYQDKLAADEKERVRNQHKFYALLGQSLLGEGLKYINF